MIFLDGMLDQISFFDLQQHEFFDWALFSVIKSSYSTFINID